MYEINYAYSEHDDNYKMLSPQELIDQLFQKTDERGLLFVPARPYHTGKSCEGRKWLRCVMEWTEADRDQIIAEFNTLYDALTEIAAANPELGNTAGENADILSAEALEVWRKYCKDYDNGLFEKEMERSIDRLIDRELYPEMFSGRSSRKNGRRTGVRHLVDIDPVPEDEEMFLYWKYSSSLKAAVRSKLGFGPFAFDICIRAKRLYYLMAFDAPGSLVDREAKRLAIYMVLDRYCTGSSEIELQPAYALPLRGIRNVELVRDILADPALYDMINPENDMDPEVVNWSSVYYKKAETGEELIEQYDNFTLYENGSHILAERLSDDKELDPEGIAFAGSQSRAMMGIGWPDFIYYEEDSAAGRKTKGISEQEILNALQRFAAALGLDAETAGKYSVPL